MYSRFILFGDLITQLSHEQNGFALAPALQHLYSRRLDVVTRGFSGYNTEHGVVVLKHVLKTEAANPEPTVLMNIFMGTNDAANTAHQHVPIDRYKANLTNMVEMAQAQGIKVIVTGPTLHDGDLCEKALIGGGRANPFSSSKITREYADVAKQVAQDHQAPFVDLWLAFQKHGGWLEAELLGDKCGFGELLTDGIHFTPTAYRIFYDELVKAIDAAYPELSAAALPQVLPHHDEIDRNDIEGCLTKAFEARHGA